ncbi:hypothetical protein JW916_08715 [Candidatus Sumerlaeota bacterium]|nr:hypothetical protein [Candidatus Sumerlaeota bacterium]
MSDIHYRIHGLIDVSIDADVCDAIVESVDFQIRHFRCSPGPEPAPHQVRVRPFNAFREESGEAMETFHTVQGVTARCYRDTASRVAFLRTPDGYEIYADSPDFLVNLFIQLLLVEENITLVHAAAVVDPQGRATLLAGPGGVGKTALLGEMVGRRGYRLLGDDIVALTDCGECLSFPRSFVLKEYHGSVYPELFERLGLDKGRRRSFSLKEGGLRALWFVRDNAPFMGLVKSLVRAIGFYDTVARTVPPPSHRVCHDYVAAVPVEEIFGPDAVADRGPVDRVVFLERYAGETFERETMREEAVCRRMFAIVHHEWVDSMRRFFALGALEIVDLEAYFHRVADIMRAGVSRKKCERLRIPEGASPDDLSRFFFSE